MPTVPSDSDRTYLGALVLLGAAVFSAGCSLVHSGPSYSAAWWKAHAYAQSHYTAWAMSGEASGQWCMNMSMEFDGAAGTGAPGGRTAAQRG
jgi:hypothetical protein